MVKCVSSFLLFSLLSVQAMSAENHIDLHQPKDFVDITTVAPDVQVDMRYFSSHNFIGRPIKGYNAPVCLLTRPAANAVKQVADRLRPFGLTLKIYDCYRPQSAVNDFIAWAKRSFSKPNEKRILSAGREKSVCLRKVILPPDPATVGEVRLI